MASQDDVTISRYNYRSILVTGNTFSIKGTLKSLGGSWNKTLKGWIFRQRDREAVVAGLGALPGIAVTDQTPEGIAGGSGAAAATATSAGVGTAAEVDDDYSDLAANPTPNKGTFGESGVPGERMAARLPEQIRHHAMFGVGGRPVEYTTHGDVFEVRSRREWEEKRAKDQEDDYDGGGGINVDGTMYRHTSLSWEDAPVEFKRPHEVEASKGRGKAVRSVCYEHKIEDSTPFDCDVYWEAVWEKCPACQEADQSFKRWAVRASTPAAVAAQKKRKAGEEAASASASTSEAASSSVAPLASSAAADLDVPALVPQPCRVP
eukprot:CAMPEP_0171814724 /NCGR_PEP_ID=MMETSP0991-20121206/79893_1 /TAXON_ID=483369 /ORGANISM="non described non described, Strain CCMP2098" /LENGTH=319 /DNA_ID=CAMNT_0012428375 /DNA_START=12 /DNA_END=968 /DNA_ORIENTATION=+